MPLVPVTHSRPIPRNIAEARAIWGRGFVFFVDLSRWNKISDYKSLKSNIDGAIIKITGVDGSSSALHRDAAAPAHIAGLAGLPLGGYHYARHVAATDHRAPVPSAREQAAYFGREAARLGLRLAVLDLEPAEVRAAILAGWAPARLESWVRDFMAELPRHYSGLVAVYLSGETIRRASGGLDFLAAGPWPLWWAGYPEPSATWPPEGPSAPLGMPPGWSWAAWQYAGGDPHGGRAPGADGDTDCNLAPRTSPIGRIFAGPPSPLATLATLAIFAALFVGGLKWLRS